MSAILGANTVYKAGLITYMPEGKGERNYDAISADVIPQGSVLFHDYGNATPSARGFKLPGLSGAERGPYIVSTKAKAAGKTKVVGVESGFEVTVIAGGTIAGGAYVKPSTTTIGRVDQLVQSGTPDNWALAVGIYVRKGKYANSGDGNNAIGAAAAGDVIVIKLL